MTTKIDIGSPPSGFRRWESVEMCFHDFADHPAETETEVHSPEFMCLGHRWCISVCPHGYETSDPGMVAIYLYHRSNEPIEIDYLIITRDSDLEEIARRSAFAMTYNEDDFDGDDNFAERTTLLEEALENGTLAIEVRMRLSEPSAINTPAQQFIPSNPINKNILSMYLDEESSDVVFEVEPTNVPKSKTRLSSKKKAKPSPVNFNAHHLILLKSAPALAEMCGNGGNIAITDVEPEIFRHALYYAYGGKVADEDMQANAKKIIDAADIFGMVNLKLEAEACYVKSTDIDLDNMMDNLLYADAKNCALLKEAVIDFVVENDEDVLEKVSLKDMPGGMFADLLTAMARAKKKDANAEGDGVKLSTMRVSELRKKLDEKGLEVDGSRESMIQTLKEHTISDKFDSAGQARD